MMHDRDRWRKRSIELGEALRKAIAWGDAASTHILYRENINWRYLDEARATLTAQDSLDLPIHFKRPIEEID